MRSKVQREGKVESLVAHRKRLLRAKDSGAPLRLVPVYIPKRTHRRSNSECSTSSLSSVASDESGHPAVLDGEFNDIDPTPELKRVERSPRLIGFAHADSSDSDDQMGLAEMMEMAEESKASQRKHKSKNRSRHRNVHVVVLCSRSPFAQHPVLCCYCLPPPTSPFHPFPCIRFSVGP